MAKKTQDKIKGINPADQRLAQSALEKKRAGQKPNAQESAALRRVEKQIDDQKRWEHYQSIPKRHWQEMSGRQCKVLNEQARRHGVPLLGSTIDLTAVVKWLHDFLADNKFLIQQGNDALMEGGGDSEWLEEYRKYRAKREQLQYERELGQWLPREEVHQGMVLMAST